MADNDDRKVWMKHSRGVPLAGVAALLEKMLISSTDALAAAQTAEPATRQLSRQHLMPISIYDYVERLRNYGHFDMSFVIALVYIDRLRTRPDFAVTPLNVHRIILVCTMIAEKYIHDVVYLNSYYAHVGGISLKELNCFEVLLLNKLKWRVGVSAEEYDQKRLELCRVVYRCRDLSTDAAPADSKRACVQVTAGEHEERVDHQGTEKPDSHENRRWADFTPPNSPPPSISEMEDDPSTSSEDDRSTSSSPRSTSSGPTVSNSTAMTCPSPQSSCEGHGWLSPESHPFPNAMTDLQATQKPRDLREQEDTRRWADFTPPASPPPSISLTKDDLSNSSSPTSTNSGPTVSNSTVMTSPNQESSYEGHASFQHPPLHLMDSSADVRATRCAMCSRLHAHVELSSRCEMCPTLAMADGWLVG